MHVHQYVDVVPHRVHVPAPAGNEIGASATALRTIRPESAISESRAFKRAGEITDKRLNRLDGGKPTVAEDWDQSITLVLPPSPPAPIA